MIYGLWPTLLLFGPAVVVGVVLGVFGNDGAAAITAAGVFFMTIAGLRWTSSRWG